MPAGSVSPVCPHESLPPLLLEPLPLEDEPLDAVPLLELLGPVVPVSSLSPQATSATPVATIHANAHRFVLLSCTRFDGRALRRFVEKRVARLAVRRAARFPEERWFFDASTRSQCGSRRCLDRCSQP
jgi:hypothetical protein